LGRELEGESSAMITMLNHMCDMVIHLDSSLRITKYADKFRALLMLQPGSPVEGEQLNTFMPSVDDHQLLEQQLLGHGAETSDAHARTGLLHVKLRDSLGNVFAAELFFVQFQRLGRKGYMVGLRESGETSMAELRTFSPRNRPRRNRRNRSIARPGHDGDHNGLIAPTTIGSSSEGLVLEAEPQIEMAVSAQTSGDPAGRVHPGRGTPPSAIREGLPRTDTSGVQESDSEQFTSLSTTMSDDTCPPGATDGLEPTSRRAKRFTLLNALSKWRLGASGPAWCCPLHAAIMDARKMLGALERCTCDRGFSAGNAKQCERCGILEPRGVDLCSICEHDEFTGIATMAL